MRDRHAAVVLGAGPAGLGLLVGAIRRGEHAALLDEGVVWVESGHRPGRGSIGEHDIDSDTSAAVLLECLAGGGPLAGLAAAPQAERVRGYGSGPLPLAVVADFLEALGRACAEVIGASASSALLLGRRATGVVVPGPGHRRVGPLRVRMDDGSELEAETVVQALGGSQDRPGILGAAIGDGDDDDGDDDDGGAEGRDGGGVTLADTCAGTAVLSARLLAPGGVAELERRLAGVPRPNAVVIGSSHSAVTAVNLLLGSRIPFGDGAVTLLCRRPPTIAYPDVASALEDGYHDFGPRDICPVTGRVHRLSGLRMAGRDLLRRVWGLGGSGPEPRVRIALLGRTGRPQLRSMLGAASVVVPAFGYRPRTVPVQDADGAVPLLAHTGPAAPLVDGRCRLLRADGSPVPGLLGIGLASGFVPSGPRLGGEPSFRGQTNGLWLYQNGVGSIVLDEVRARTAIRSAATSGSASSVVPSRGVVVPAS